MRAQQHKRALNYNHNALPTLPSPGHNQARNVDLLMSRANNSQLGRAHMFRSVEIPDPQTGPPSRLRPREEDKANLDLVGSVAPTES